MSGVYDTEFGVHQAKIGSTWQVIRLWRRFLDPFRIPIVGIRLEKDADDDEGEGEETRDGVATNRSSMSPKKALKVAEETARDRAKRNVHLVDLLYDLVMVAALNVFSTHHEVSSAYSVLVYFSFFVILWWVWASQTLYDVRFESDDWLHRVQKFMQLVIFAFIGATGAQYFDPSHVLNPADVTSSEAVADAGGASAFQGVGISYGVGRILLAFEYVIVIFQCILGNHISSHARRRAEQSGHANDATYFYDGIASHLIAAVSAAVSGVCWFLAAGLITIPAANGNLGLAPAKLALAYGGLLIEFVCAIIMPLPKQSFLMHGQKPSEFSEQMIERFGELTLIILGEGIIGLTSSFSAVIAGFGFTENAYIQCFSALVVAFAAWQLLFHGLRKDEEFAKWTDNGMIWFLLHLPLHFAILLLFAGMRNSATYSNISDAWSQVQAEFNVIENALLSGRHSGNFSANSSSSALLSSDYYTLQFEKLALNPSFPIEIQNLQLEFDSLASYNGSAGNFTSTFVDPYIDLLQYEAQFLTALGTAYDCYFSEEVDNLALQVSNVTRTFIPDPGLRNYTERSMNDLLDDFESAYLTDLGQGVLFFLPAAGGVVLISSILFLLKDKQELSDDASPPSAIGIWFCWIVRTCVGLGLCGLGFLDLGNQTISNTGTGTLLVYRLLNNHWIIPIVAISYVGVIIVDTLVTVITTPTAQEIDKKMKAQIRQNELRQKDRGYSDTSEKSKAEEDNVSSTVVRD